MASNFRPQKLADPAGFHRDPAGRNVLEGCGEILPADLLLHDVVPFFVESDKMKNRFCQVDAECRNLHGGSSFF